MFPLCYHYNLTIFFIQNNFIINQRKSLNPQTSNTQSHSFPITTILSRNPIWSNRNRFKYSTNNRRNVEETRFNRSEKPSSVVESLHLRPIERKFDLNAGIIRVKPGYRRSDRATSDRKASSRADPRDIGLLCNRCVSCCVSICPVYICSHVYASYPVNGYIGQCAARVQGV